MFYLSPVALSSTSHTGWRLRPGDARFAKHASAIPLVSSDIAPASRTYPILFTSGTPSPVALVALDKTNLFVEAGAWAAGAHVPAYVRRYPFILAEIGDGRGFNLAVDQASDLIAKQGEDGEALFEGGEPSTLTQRALEFSRLFKIDLDGAQAFANALQGAGLFVERRAEVILSNGRKLVLEGFQVVDSEKLAALPDQTVVDWHRNGWLHLLYLHLASLDRFSDLLDRQNKLEASATPVGSTPARAPA